MEIVATTKFRHGGLHRLLKQCGWTLTELARRAELDYNTVGRIVRLQSRPTQSQADSIQRAFGEAGVFFDVLASWPEGFSGFKKSPVTMCFADIPNWRLISIESDEVLSLPESSADEKDYCGLHAAIERLTSRQQTVVKMVMLDGCKEAEVATKLHVTRGMVSAILVKSMRRLRHPESVRIILDPLMEGP